VASRCRITVTVPETWLASRRRWQLNIGERPTNVPVGKMAIDLSALTASTAVNPARRASWVVIGTVQPLSER
jgi:hypothetical protein